MQETKINKNGELFFPAEGTTMINIEEGWLRKINPEKPDFSNVTNKISASHALEIQEKNYLAKREQFEFKMLETTFGSQLPFVLARERSKTAKIKRLGGLKSSNIHLEVLLGQDEILDPSDFLQDQYVL